MRWILHFEPILQLHLWWLLTLVQCIWPLTAWTFKGCHTVSIYKPSLVPIRLQLFKWVHFFSLSFNLTWWPLTLICDLWRLQQVRVPRFHLWPNFGWIPSKCVECGAKCSPAYTITDKHQWTLAIPKHVTFISRQHKSPNIQKKKNKTKQNKKNSWIYQKKKKKKKKKFNSLFVWFKHFIHR